MTDKKFSFHVSSHPNFLFSSSGVKALADPYILDFIDDPDLEYVLLERPGTDRRSYGADLKYINEKVCAYRRQVINFLVETFGESEKFFLKVLGMGFVRFVNLAYDNFQVCRKFDPKLHEVKALSLDVFSGIKDFEEHRYLFQHQPLGHEAAFSVFLQEFHSELYDSCKFELASDERGRNDSVRSFPLCKNEKYSNSIVKRLSRRVLSFRKPKVLIVDSFFSQENIDNLLLKSKGQIQAYALERYNGPFELFDASLRGSLSQSIHVEDEFDYFFRRFLYHFFPIICLEGFCETKRFYENRLANYNGVSHIISESWLSDSQLSFFLAVMQKHQVKHVFNEHNFLQHFIDGNHIEHTVDMCDIYYSLGWEDSDYPQVVRGASLFDFEGKYSQEIDGVDILYIASFPSVRSPEVSSAYGEQGRFAKLYLHYIETFFHSLSEPILNRITFRAYPNRNGWLQYRLDRLKKFNLENLKFDNFAYSSKVMMKSAKLIVVDYFSTAYLEALKMNKPIIILYDSNRTYLRPKYNDIFKELLDVGIIQECPMKAAKFINTVDIDEWWEQEVVRTARENFIRENLGPAEEAINFYLGLLPN